MVKTESLKRKTFIKSRFFDFLRNHQFLFK